MTAEVARLILQLLLTPTVLAVPSRHHQDRLAPSVYSASTPDESGGRVRALSDSLMQQRIAEHQHVGMNPHANAGADEEAPHTFSYRYQFQDPHTNELTYYEYQAKRHPHVVILDEAIVVRDNTTQEHACTSSIRHDGNVTVKLLLSPTKLKMAKLKTGSIVVATDKRCHLPNGAPVNLRERVVRPPLVTAHASGAKHVELTVTSAGLHECFHHSTLEFFRGTPHVLETWRQKRMKSLAKLGEGDHAHPFASTKTVLADAKASAKQLLTRMRKEQTREADMRAMVLINKGNSIPCAVAEYSTIPKLHVWGHDCSGAISIGKGPLDSSYYSTVGDSASVKQMRYHAHHVSNVTRAVHEQTLAHRSPFIGRPGVVRPAGQVQERWFTGGWAGQEGTVCTADLVNQHKGTGEQLNWIGRAPACRGKVRDCTDSGLEFICASHDGADEFADIGYGSSCSCFMICSGQKVLCSSGPPVEVSVPSGNDEDFGCTIRSDEHALNLNEQVDGADAGSGRYRVAWQYPGPDRTHDTVTYVKLQMYELDDISDDSCGTLETEEYGTGKIPFGYKTGEWVQVTVTLKSQKIGGCSGELSFPEYQFRLVQFGLHGNDKSCTLARYPNDGDHPQYFRLLTATDLTFEEKKLTGDLDWHEEWPTDQREKVPIEGQEREEEEREEEEGEGVGEEEKKSGTLTADVTCKDCGITLSGSLHIITRSSNYFPFKEVWAIGEPNLHGKIDFEAVIQGEYTYSNTKNVIPDICAYPLCVGGKLAGVGVALGLMPSIAATIDIDFAAELTLKYKRQIDVSGTIAGHALHHAGHSPIFQITKEVEGFEPGVQTHDEDEEETPLGLTMDIEARVQLTITPELKIGLFAEAGDLLAAEAGVHATLNLAGIANYQGKFGTGKSVEPMAVEGSCDKWSEDADCCNESGGLPVCVHIDTCGQKHQQQLDFLAYAEAVFKMSLHAQADFGIWKKQFAFQKYFTPDGFTEQEAKFFRKDMHIASLCFGPVSAEDAGSGSGSGDVAGDLGSGMGSGSG